MTMDEIRASDKVTLTPIDISEVLGSHPKTIHDTAIKRPDLIGYKFTFVGNRMKISRKSFIDFIDGRDNDA